MLGLVYSNSTRELVPIMPGVTFEYVLPDKVLQSDWYQALKAWYACHFTWRRHLLLLEHDLRALHMDIVLVYAQQADKVLWQFTKALAQLVSIISVPTIPMLRLAISQ